MIAFDLLAKLATGPNFSVMNEISSSAAEWVFCDSPKVGAYLFDDGSCLAIDFENAKFSAGRDISMTAFNEWIA